MSLTFLDMAKGKQKLSIVHGVQQMSKVLDTLLRSYSANGHNCITQLLQICQLDVHNANLS